MSRLLKGKDELENTFVQDRVKELLPLFEALAPRKPSERKKGVPNANLIGTKKLASIEAVKLKSKYPDNKDEDDREYGTCLRQITALKKELKKAAKTELKDSGLINQVNTIITSFGNDLSYLFSEYKEKQNFRYRGQVKERRKVENRIEIDLTNSLKFSYNILNDIKSGKNDVNWLDVSCALGLATGRRMAEIHLSATFEPTDNTHTVIFKGQLKGKQRKERIGNKSVLLIEYPFEIPTLLPAELVILGLNWLTEKGKRFDKNEDVERVNKRFSKVLNLHCKDYDIFPEGERTYHKFRAAYLRASIINDGNVDPYDFTDFAKEILGDDDESTINAYKRYEIKLGTLTRI